MDVHSLLRLPSQRLTEARSLRETAKQPLVRGCSVLRPDRIGIFLLVGFAKTAAVALPLYSCHSWASV